MPDFVAFAASNGVTALHFNEVGIYSGATQHDLNIVDLPDGEFEEAVAHIEVACKLAERLGLGMTVAETPRIRERQRIQAEGGTFTKNLVEASTPVSPLMIHNEGNTVPEGYTRACASPWSEFYLDPHGQVFACCIRGGVMGKAKTAEEIAAVLENDAYRNLRNSLRTGVDLDPACASCPIRPIVPVRKQQKASRTASRLLTGLRGFVFGQSST
jgi:radical SAM protein with 4Fe4S-binding SPASM domain